MQQNPIQTPHHQAMSFTNVSIRVQHIQCVPLSTEPGMEDIATKFEQEYVRCVRNEEECVCGVCL
jgi:hypothetical protein